MNNFYHKIAVTCICTALSFTLITNKEAKAATLSLEMSQDFFIESNPSGLMFTDSKSGPSGHSFLVEKTRFTGIIQAAFFEFSLSNLSFIKSAIFSVQQEEPQLGLGVYVQIFGYTGNGKADLSDFNAGESLGSLFSNDPGRIQLDVTKFVDERVSNHDAFVGFGIMPPALFRSSRSYIQRTYYRPQLIVETADVAEPVPEPTTIFGSALALGVGGWLKRKKSSQKNKTTSQH
jgi:hypothetical protein